MTKEYFVQRKTELIDLIHEALKDTTLSNLERESLTHLLNIMGMYIFENRMQLKGLISHTIVDSLELDYSLGEKFIQFDNSIS